MSFGELVICACISFGVERDGHTTIWCKHEERISFCCNDPSAVCSQRGAGCINPSPLQSHSVVSSLFVVAPCKVKRVSRVRSATVFTAGRTMTISGVAGSRWRSDVRRAVAWMTDPMHIHGVRDSEFAVLVMDSVEVCDVVDALRTTVRNFTAGYSSC